MSETNGVETNQVERIVSALEYTDKNGRPVNVGDILYYDEGYGFAKGIHEVVIKDGKLSGKTHLFNGVNGDWEALDAEDVISLEHYTAILASDLILNDAEVIGNLEADKDMLTVDWARDNKPIAY